VKKNFHFFLSVILLSFFLIFIGAFFWWKNNSLPVDIQNKQKTAFSIDKGESVDQVSKKLLDQKLIKSQLHFKINVYVLKISRKIQAGGYFLSPSMSEKEIALSLTKGNNDLWVTIVEGLRSEQIGLLLIKQFLPIDYKHWVAYIKQNNLEGKIFPDSYFFPKDASQEKIMEIVLRNFDKKVTQDLLKKYKSDLSLNEILTLASIIEREAKTKEDRKMVAGILLKRIENSWPLQVDATIQYLIASNKSKNRVSFEENYQWWPSQLSKLDLQTNSVFNTYLNRGIPPSPICNPGLSSIEAVVNPTRSEYWYYLSDETGKTYFAKTDEEHNQNIQKYLKH
jgi:UPF0755 protein